MTDMELKCPHCGKFIMVPKGALMIICSECGRPFQHYTDANLAKRISEEVKEGREDLDRRMNQI